MGFFREGSIVKKKEEHLVIGKKEKKLIAR
jgi:hypothetical protein